MDEANKRDSICRDLGLSSAASTQLQSCIRRYIEQWNLFAPDEQKFDNLGDSDIEEHCSRYLDIGWDRDERVGKETGKGKAKGKGASKGDKVQPGRIFWQSQLGQKRTKYDYSRDFNIILVGVRKIFAILKKPPEASDWKHVENVSASKQVNSGREVPSSPEAWNGDNDPLDDHRAQNRVACQLTIPTSQEQPVSGSDDDDPYRPAPSEVDSDGRVRGDTPLDLNTSKDCRRAPNNKRIGPRGQTHMLPDQESTKQTVKAHPATDESRDNIGPGQKHTAYNEPKVSQTHLCSPNSSTQASIANHADRPLRATGELDSEPAAKRPRNDRVMARSFPGPRNAERDAQYHRSNENVHTEEQPALPSFSYDLKRPRPSTNNSHRDDRSQTLMVASTEGSFGERSPERGSTSCEPEDPGYSYNLIDQPIDRRRETSLDLEVSQPLQSRTSEPPRSLGNIVPSKGIPPMRFWILVRKHPRKSWKNLPDTTFHNQSLDSFYSCINSQAGIGQCPSIEVTLSTADEDHIISLPRDDEDRFEMIKAFVSHKCRLSQVAQKGESMALDVYLVP